MGTKNMHEYMKEYYPERYKKIMKTNNNKNIGNKTKKYTLFGLF